MPKTTSTTTTLKMKQCGDGCTHDHSHDHSHGDKRKRDGEEGGAADKEDATAKKKPKEVMRVSATRHDSKVK